MKEMVPIEYARPTPPPRRPSGLVSLSLVGFQFVWVWPAAFGAWVLLCDAGMIRHAAANVAGAAFVVAPSLAAVALGSRVAWRRRRERAQLGFAMGGILGGLAWIGYVAAAVVQELLHPSPFPCG
jgi:hypothetical protein